MTQRLGFITLKMPEIYFNLMYSLFYRKQLAVSANLHEKLTYEALLFAKPQKVRLGAAKSNLYKLGVARPCKSYVS